MRPNQLPAEPLAEVTFIHDYVQFGFQGDRFSCYNRMRVSGTSGSAMQGESAFAGALVGLIGQRVMRVTHSNAAALELHFAGGTSVQVLRGAGNEFGPESFQFSREGHALVVERN